MTTELVVGPRAEDVRTDLAEAPGWSAYVTKLREVLAAVIGTTGAEPLEVGGLLVGEPLPESLVGLRNGLEVGPAQAVELVVGMVAGHGPYCQLTSPGRLRVESGWDGFVHLFVTAAAADAVQALGADDDLVLDRRVAEPEDEDVPNPVTTAADDAFWSEVGAAAGTAKLTLLCERWAHGAYGCRWFRVTPENVAAAAEAVRPRSLLSVVVDPDLRLDPLFLDDDFTAFKAPLAAGELTYRAGPRGADDLRELTDDDFAFLLRDSAPVAWRAVVPDSDGVVRGRWEEEDPT
ncbi:hypothetical protein ABZZ80_29490 [Streptomyces sp. NPDC006356]